MEYVTDFQSFRDDGNNYIIKELCVQPIVTVSYTHLVTNIQAQNKLIPKHVKINTKHDTIFKTLNIGNTQ